MESVNNNIKVLSHLAYSYRNIHKFNDGIVLNFLSILFDKKPKIKLTFISMLNVSFVCLYCYLVITYTLLSLVYRRNDYPLQTFVQ